MQEPKGRVGVRALFYDSQFNSTSHEKLLKKLKQVFGKVYLLYVYFTLDFLDNSMILWPLPYQVSPSLPVSATGYSLYMVNGESTYKRVSLGKEL